jgi:hypothetical protein
VQVEVEAHQLLGAEHTGGSAAKAAVCQGAPHSDVGARLSADPGDYAMGWHVMLLGPLQPGPQQAPLCRCRKGGFRRRPGSCSRVRQGVAGYWGCRSGTYPHSSGGWRTPQPCRGCTRCSCSHTLKHSSWASTDAQQQHPHVHTERSKLACTVMRLMLRLILMGRLLGPADAERQGGSCLLGIVMFAGLSGRAGAEVLEVAGKGSHLWGWSELPLRT